MKLKALKTLLTNKFYTKYIPTTNVEDHVVEKIIHSELEKLFLTQNIGET